MAPSDLIVVGFVVVALTGMILIGSDIFINSEENDYYDD